MSEKKQKLSPDFAGTAITGTLESEFKPFIEDGRQDSLFAGLVAESHPVERDFGLPDQFWRWIDSDSELRSQFEQMIEAKVNERSAVRCETVRPTLEAAAQQAGFDLGYQEGMKAAVQALEKLEVVSQAVVKEKAALLRDHEGHWLRTMRHLLDRFMVKNGVDVAGHLEGWISEGVLQFEQAGQIRISLSTKDFEDFSKAGGFSQGRSWQLVEDPSLPVGHIHCECGDGGFVFRPGSEMKKLEAMVDGYLAEKGVSPQ